MLESLEKLDAIKLNFSQESLFVLNLTLAFIMFGIALEIKPEHFKRILLNPKSTIVGIISQFLLLPLVTFILVISMGKVITPTVALGMLLVASCPGGNISNFISSLARANIALSVSLTAITTLSAIIITPLNFSLWGGLYTKVYSKMNAESLVRPLEIDAMQMFQTVFILLGIPMIIGVFLSYKYPGFAKKIVKPIKILSILIFIAIVILAFARNYEHFTNHITYIFFIVLIHNALALTTGFFAGMAGRVPRIDRRSIAIETGIQNSGLALVLLFNPKIFPSELFIGGMAFIAAWWGIWHILSGLGIAALWSKIPIIRDKF